MNNPMPFFCDKSVEIKSLEVDVNSLLLSSISSTCNKLVLPSISCGWVCSEFLHRKGEITFDIIIQSCLP